MIQIEKYLVQTCILSSPNILSMTGNTVKFILFIHSLDWSPLTLWIICHNISDMPNFFSNLYLYTILDIFLFSVDSLALNDRFRDFFFISQVINEYTRTGNRVLDEIISIILSLFVAATYDRSGYIMFI